MTTSNTYKHQGTRHCSFQGQPPERDRGEGWREGDGARERDRESERERERERKRRERRWIDNRTIMTDDHELTVDRHGG